jgi:hypothetical protein
VTSVGPTTARAGVSSDAPGADPPQQRSPGWRDYVRAAMNVNPLTTAIGLHVGMMRAAVTGQPPPDRGPSRVMPEPPRSRTGGVQTPPLGFPPTPGPPGGSLVRAGSSAALARSFTPAGALAAPATEAIRPALTDALMAGVRVVNNGLVHMQQVADATQSALTTGPGAGSGTGGAKGDAKRWSDNPHLGRMDMERAQNAVNQRLREMSPAERENVGMARPQDIENHLHRTSEQYWQGLDRFQADPGRYQRALELARKNEQLIPRDFRAVAHIDGTGQPAVQIVPR